MKTILALLLALCVAMGCAGAMAKAETAPVEWFDGEGEVYNSLGEHFRYKIEDDHAVLTCYWVEKGRPQPAVVEPPATLGGKPLTVIGEAAFDNFDGIVGFDGNQMPYDGEQVERIVIPVGVTTLREGAFYCAHFVQQIDLPTTIVEIQTELTFNHVTAEIDFPNGNPFYQVENGFLIDIRTDALLYCWPSTGDQPLPRVRRVEDYALANYSAQQTVLEFPDSVEYIGSFNAYDCVDIETIIVPGSVKELADSAFQCNSAQEIILHEGLEKIGYWTFADTEINSITIPSTVQVMNEEAFGWWEPDELIVLNPDMIWEEAEKPEDEDQLDEEYDE